MMSAGNKVVLNKPSPEHKVEDAEFEPNEVYAIDIVVSSGQYKQLFAAKASTLISLPWMNCDVLLMTPTLSPASPHCMINYVRL